MIKKLQSLLLFGMIISLFSCKKDSPLTYPIEGLWIGTYTVDQNSEQQPLFYSFSIKPDGTVLAESKGSDGISYYSSGIWTLTGNKFDCTITTINLNPKPITQSASLTYDNSGKLTNGTWKDIDNPYNSGYTGKFSVINRVN
jgi:hypothetical protein